VNKGLLPYYEGGLKLYRAAVFMLVDHSRDALMQRPYKVLVMMM